MTELQMAQVRLLIPRRADPCRKSVYEVLSRSLQLLQICPWLHDENLHAGVNLDLRLMAKRKVSLAILIKSHAKLAQHGIRQALWPPPAATVKQPISAAKKKKESMRRD